MFLLRRPKCVLYVAWKLGGKTRETVMMNSSQSLTSPTVVSRDVRLVPGPFRPSQISRVQYRARSADEKPENQDPCGPFIRLRDRSP